MGRARPDLLALILFAALGGPRADDCDGNGIPDECDIRPWPVVLSLEAQMLLGASPRSVAISDLDGDEDLDLASANRRLKPRPGTIAVLLGEGDGMFRPPTVIPLEIDPVSIAAGDFDGDRLADLAVSGRQGGFLVLPGRGLGAFGEGRPYSMPGQPALSACDLDRDDMEDLIVSPNSDAGEIRIYWGRKDGDLQPSTFALGGTAGGSTIADIDGDGREDLLVALYSPPSVKALENRGGRVMVLETLAATPEGSGTGLVCDDIDGDGKLDLVVGNHIASTASILLGADGGSFSLAGTLSFDSIPMSLATEDLDGDGAPDLAVRFEDSACRIYRNRDGEFPEADVELAGFWSLDLADLEADGDIDLIGADGPRGLVAVHANDGSGEFGEPTCWPVTVKPAGILIADLDRDGIRDFGLDGTGAFATIRNEGSWLLGEPAFVDLGGRFRAAVDLHGDGDLDLVASTGPEDPRLPSRVLVARNRGDGTFESPTAHPGGASSLAAADLEPDGDIDIVTAAGSTAHAGHGITSILLNDGTGTLGAPIEYPWGGREMAPPADIDGDGQLDMAALDDGAINVSLNQGFPALIRVEVPVEDGARGIAAADFDSDGLLDLATAYGTGSSLAICFFDGGAFRAPVEIDTGLAPRLIAAADLDGDEDIDLAISCDGDPTAGEEAGFSVLRNDGTGSFESGYHPQAREVLALSVADTNGDGAAEIAAWAQDRLQDDTPDAKVILAMVWGSGQVLYDVPYRADSSGTIAFGDLDGDGRSDLAIGEAERFLVYANRSPPAAADGDRDGVPDRCEGAFHRGDPNGDGRTDLADAVSILSHLFLGGEAPACRESADIGNDGEIDISDPIALLRFLFLGGPPPAAPGPPGEDCGPDPDAPGSAGDLGCASYRC